jgi:hypothetical protein
VRVVGNSNSQAARRQINNNTLELICTEHMSHEATNITVGHVLYLFICLTR